mgnify:CR=1 FL=1|jgi:glycosyltransferase involved in cell wall biosynthesis
MNILIIHEIDWIEKVIFEPHHLAELFSIAGNNVFVLDCPNSNIKNLFKGFQTKIFKNFHRIYDNSSITLVRPKSIRMKGLNRLTHFLSCKSEIKKIILENNIDIILLYGVATNGIQTIEIAKKMNIPVVFRVLDVAHKLVTNSILRKQAKKHEQFVLQHSDEILATTPQLSKYAIKMGAPVENTNSFSLGINAEIFKPLEKSIKIQKNFGITNSDFVILFIGTIFKFSGLYELISQFDQILKISKNVKFIIVGGGTSLSKLKLLALQKNLDSHIFFTGFVPQNEIPNYISVANLCINPFQVNSITNRILPTKILEYLACAKPVLSTPLEGTMELLPDEKFGILYSSSDDFAQTLSKLITSKSLDKLGLAGNQYVQNNHNWEKLSQQLLTKFKNIIKIKTENK